jgi:hypothetical protein
VSGLLCRGGSGTGERREADEALTGGGAGDLSIDRRGGISTAESGGGDWREGGRGGRVGFVTGTRLGDAFSGLLGGVLNGDTRSREAARGWVGAREGLESWNVKFAGFAGILGFDARWGWGASPVDPADVDNPGDR